jgi:hypothetical protein
MDGLTVWFGLRCSAVENLDSALLFLMFDVAWLLAWHVLLPNISQAPGTLMN